MRVLLMSQWYSPEPVKLLSEMAESLRDLGHDVEVLTGFPNYPSGVLYDGYKLRLRRRETMNGIPVTRVPLYPDHSRSALKRILNYLSFAFSAATIGLFSTRKPDVILSYGSPYTTSIAATIHGMFRRVPFVLDVVDLWPESVGSSGMLSKGLVYRMIDAFTRWVYRRATCIVVVSPGFFRTIAQRGVPEGKLTVISNWVDTEYYAPQPPDPATIERFHLVGKFNVLFAGNVGPAQGIETIVEAAQLLQSSPDIQITIAGGGISVAPAQERARELGLTNLQFLGQLPSSAMPPLFASVDALLVHLKREPLYDITIPHKIYAYMASGKPVLAAVSGDAADVIASAHAGVSCPPGDPAALAAAIRKLASTRQPELEAMGANGRKAAETLYSRPRLVRMLSDVLESAIREYSKKDGQRVHAAV